MNTIAPHHQRAIEKITAKFEADPQVVALLLAGSIAKSVQKDNSDVDVIVILTDEAIALRQRENRLAECILELCDYKNGYADIKYFPKEFLVAAAERGSEPTRNSFIGARCLFSRDHEIPGLVARIPVYQRHEKADKMMSFFAGLQLSSVFFWWEAVKRNDPYLKTRMVSEIVLFGCRLILAHNERLFPCQKRLIEAIDACPDKPANFRALLDVFLANPTNENMKAFAECVAKWRDWCDGKGHAALTRYQQDHEQWWYLHRPYIAEW